jgi:hypothetical protein
MSAKVNFYLYKQLHMPVFGIARRQPSDSHSSQSSNHTPIPKQLLLQTQ